MPGTDDDGMGPQAARNRRFWMTKHLEEHAVQDIDGEKQQEQNVLSDVPASIQQQQQDLLRGQIISLTDEKKFFTEYIARILDQLRHLLQKYGELDKLKLLTSNPLTSPDLHAETREKDDNLITPWSVAKECLNPLLLAYDLQIAEFQETIEENKKALNAISARSDLLTKENTTLRKELEASTEKLMERARQNQFDEPVTATTQLLCSHGFDSIETSEYLVETNERLEVLIAENSTLMQQISIQDEELSVLQKDIAEKDQQLMTMGSNFNNATLSLQKLKDSCDLIQKEKKHCESQFQHYALRIAQLETEKDAVLEQKNAHSAEIQSLKEQCKSFERDLSAIKAISDEKEEHFVQKYQNVCVRLRDLTNALDGKEKINDDLQDRNRSMNLEIESMKQDCEGMLRVMNNMEKQLAQYASREDAVIELEAETKLNMANLLLEKEKAENRESSSRREIARLLECTQNQALQYVKERDEAITSRAKKHEIELRQRDSDANKLSSELGELRGKLATILRTHKDNELRLADSIGRAKMLSEEFEKQLKILAKRLEAVEEARDAAQLWGEEQLRMLQITQDELSKAQLEFREHTSSLNEKCSRVERELECRRLELRDLKSACEERDCKIQILNEQLIKVKSDCASRFTAELESVTIQNQKLKSSLMELELRLQQCQRDTQSDIDAALMKREKIEHRYQAEIETLRSRVVALKEERRRYENCQTNAEARCSVVGLQMQELSHKFDDLRELYAEKEDTCDELERKIADLGSQLSLALSKQHHSCRQERELRCTTEKLMMEKAHIERELAHCQKKLKEYQSKPKDNEPYQMFAMLGHKQTKSASPFCQN